MAERVKGPRGYVRLADKQTGNPFSALSDEDNHTPTPSSDSHSGSVKFAKVKNLTPSDDWTEIMDAQPRVPKPTKIESFEMPTSIFPPPKPTPPHTMMVENYVLPGQVPFISVSIMLPCKTPTFSSILELTIMSKFISSNELKIRTYCSFHSSYETHPFMFLQGNTDVYTFTVRSTEACKSMVREIANIHRLGRVLDSNTSLEVAYVLTKHVALLLCSLQAFSA